MDPIEILNTLAKRIFDIKEDEGNFQPYLNPQVYDESLYKRKGGILSQYNREQYLRDAIGFFIINVKAAKSKDILAGYSEARKLVTLQPGFGSEGDIHFVEKKEKGVTRTHRIRVVDRGENGINSDELNEIAYWQPLGDYIRVNTFEDFYKWYVNKFGEVEI